MDPIAKDGFELRGNFSQPAIGGDWTLSVSLVKTDLAAIDASDQTATFTCSSRVPFNEAPDEAAATAKLQELVDLAHDQFVPAPAP
jgi:hypothetical protein